MIPFETKTLFLKQVCAAELDDIERIALYFFFPGYHDGSGFQQNEVSATSLLKPFQDSGFTVVHDNNQARRYAGDFSLPRSSYFTVCRDAEGDDGGLLLHELKTYSKPHMCGYVNFVDTTAPNEASQHFRAMLRPRKSAIFCIPQELKRFPSPFRRIIGADAGNRHLPVVAIIPTQVVELSFERLIDLRVPKTRQWFVTEFTRLKNGEPPIPVFPIAGPLDDFKELLPTLLSQGLGGRAGATQPAGSWLRRLGADALIFPSARVDISVSCSGGKLQDWYGWNLVDYRGAPPPTVQSFIDISPEWDRYPTTLHHDLVKGESADSAPAVEFSHVKILASESGPNAGSLRVTGIELARGFYHDIVLWRHYTDRMDEGLSKALVHLTYLAASDGKRGIYMNHLAEVSRMFLAALHGVGEAKSAVADLPSLRHVASEGTDFRNRISSFLAICD
jgi:hypothetical protein